MGLEDVLSAYSGCLFLTDDSIPWILLPTGNKTWGKLGSNFVRDVQNPRILIRASLHLASRENRLKAHAGAVQKEQVTP